MSDEFEIVNLPKFSEEYEKIMKDAEKYAEQWSGINEQLLGKDDYVCPDPIRSFEVKIRMPLTRKRRDAYSDFFEFMKDWVSLHCPKNDAKISMKDMTEFCDRMIDKD